MRILQVITVGHDLYGAQKHVLDMSVLLREAGHEVNVAVGTTGALTDRLSEHDIPHTVVHSLVQPIRPIQDLRCVNELCRLYDEFQPDLVASHSSKAGIVSRIACSRAHIPNVFTAHGWSFEAGIPFLKRKLFLSVERWVAKKSNKIITVSKLGRAYGIKQRVASPEQLTTTYYGVADHSDVHPRVRNDVFTMTMVARFCPQKDHATLISALALLQRTDWQLNLLGDGELLPEIKQQVAAAGLSDRVNFCGAVSNVPFLSETDLLVLTTNWEGLPLSILDGLAFGIPVVASNVSGVSEGVIDGYNGLLTERGNAEQVSSAINRLLDQPDTVARFGENSRKLFEERFTQRAMFEKTLALYYEVVQNPRVGREERSIATTDR